MLVVNLYDNAFRHIPFSVPGKVGKHIIWVRDQIEFNGITVFTDNLTYHPIVDIVRSKVKVAWLLEPRELYPQNYTNIDPSEFDVILTHNEELLNTYPNKTIKVPFGGCWIEKNNYKLHEKSQGISMIYSNKGFMPGHRLRHAIASEIPGIELFGRGTPRVLDKKEEALIPFKYSIAIENSRVNNFFTEKLLDCFATGTIPIYWGCPNIGDYFDTKGILHFETIDQLKQIIADIGNGIISIPTEHLQNNLNAVEQYELTEDWITKNIFEGLL